MSIASILAVKFPGINFLTDVRLQDEGDGNVYIKEWNRQEQKPTKAQLSTWAKERDVINAVNSFETSSRNALIIQKLAEIDLASIRSIRTNDTVKMAEWEAKAQALRDQMV